MQAFSSPSLSLQSSPLPRLLFRSVPFPVSGHLPIPRGLPPPLLLPPPAIPPPLPEYLSSADAAFVQDKLCGCRREKEGPDSGGREGKRGASVVATAF